MSNYKIVYSYTPVTLEFMGEEIIYQEKATGEYPRANNVVLKKPPVPGINQAVIYDKEVQDWKLVDDFRGAPWFEPSGNLGGFVEKIGEVPEIMKAPPEHVPNTKIAWDEKIKDWYHKPDKGYIYDGDLLRPMTVVERIEAGIDELPEDAKIEDGELVIKTQEELLDEGLITKDQYNEHQRKMREAGYIAETDKIGLMVLRGEATQEEWLAAIETVKEKYPYKE